MTVKDQLRQLVEQLDDEPAVEVLAFALQRFIRGVVPGSDVSETTEPGVDVDCETLWRVAHPVTADDPLWGIIGMIDDDGPNDVASNKHRCLVNDSGERHVSR